MGNGGCMMTTTTTMMMGIGNNGEWGIGGGE